MKPNDKALDEALSVTQIPEENMREYMRRVLTAAYAAQFQSEDYAGLVKWLRDKAESLSEIYPPEADAADALETVLAERDALKAELAAGHMWIQMRAAVFEELAMVRAERDALAARLALVDDEGLVEIVTREIAFAQGSAESPSTLRRGQAREVIAAIHPHIEAAERERCAKIAANQYERMKNKGYVSVDWMHGYLSAARDIHSAIRSGK